MSEQYSPGAQEKPTFSTLNEQEKRGQEPLDVEILDEETFEPSPSTAIELHSGEVREPGIHEAEIMTEEATKQLYQARAEEDFRLAEQHAAAEQANKTNAYEAPVVDMSSFFASRLLEDSGEYSIAEQEKAEELAQTFTAIEKILDMLPKHSVLKAMFEKALEQKDEAEILNLNKIRTLLTETFKEARESNQEFTPEMAMELFEKQFKENLNAPATGKEYDPTLPDRYLTVKSLFEENPRALLVLMGMSAEEITNNEETAGIAA